MKKIIIIYLFSLLLQSCWYVPMYANNQKLDFYIEEIIFDDGDKDLSLYIKNYLNAYYKPNGNNKYKINTLIEYTKKSASNSLTGDTVEYDLLTQVKFIITSEEFKEELIITERFKMKNFSDEFEELQYEKTIKQNMARLITSKLLTQMSRFDVN